MADYIAIGISLIIFFFYLMIVVLCFQIKKRLKEDVSVSFTLIIIAIFFLIIRRVQQIFFETEIISAIPYFSDSITLIFSIVFFIAIFKFYKNLKKFEMEDIFDRELPNK